MKKYCLFVFGILLFISGGVVNAIYLNDFERRSLGLLAMVAGALLVRVSKVRGIKALGIKIGENVDPRMNKGPGKVAWSFGVAALAAIAISYVCMRRSVLAGGHAVWPVYAFAASGLFGALVWGYVAAKFMD